MFFKDTRICSSLAALVLLLVTQVLCIPRVILPLEKRETPDGGYSYAVSTTEEATPLSPQSMRDAVRDLYEEMEDRAERLDNNIKPPAAMALLFVWTNRDYTKGVLLAQSSMRYGQDPITQQYLNQCRDRNHRLYGNCAEIGAMARARSQGLSLRHGTMAVYGVQRSTGRPTHIRPCRQDDDGLGCSDYINIEGMRSITKRSRVEGIEDEETKEYGIMERAPKHVPSKAPKSKSKSKSKAATSTSLTSSIPKSPISVPSKSKGRSSVPTTSTLKSNIGSGSPSAVSTTRAIGSTNTSKSPTAVSTILEVQATMPFKASAPVATITIN